MLRKMTEKEKNDIQEEVLPYWKLKNVLVVDVGFICIYE